MVNPQDPGTGGRGPRRNRWGRRREGPAETQGASPAGAEETTGPLVSEGADPSAVSGAEPAAAGEKPAEPATEPATAGAKPAAEPATAGAKPAAGGPLVSEGSDPSAEPAATGQHGPQSDGTPVATKTGPHIEYARPEQTLETLRALGLPAVPMLVSAPEAARTEAAAERQGAVPLELPAYLPVDRAIPSEVFSLDIPVMDPDHQNVVDFIVRRPYGYPSGQSPAQAGRIPAGLNSRTAVCRSLSPRAAAWCLRRGGSF